MQQELLPSPFTSLTLRLCAWLGLAMLVFDLIVEETTIWAGGSAIESSAILAALAVPVARAISGAGWQQVVAPVYGALWLSHYLIFSAAFWARSSDSRAGPGKTACLLVLQALAALVGDGQLTLGVAAQIAFYYRPRVALPALLALACARALSDLPFILGMTGLPPANAAFSVNYIGYQGRDICVVFAMGYIARLAWQSRDRLMAANAELRATGRKLAETERDAERMRIARDLHDTVGHQLTAISLHLELGMRRAGAAIPAAVMSARDLAGAALSKLRVAVSRESGMVPASTPDGAPQEPLALPDGRARHAGLFAWAGVGACLYALLLDQGALWIGKRDALTFETSYPICKWLVAAWLPAGAALEPTLHAVYACSWMLFYFAFAAVFWGAARAPRVDRQLKLLWWVQIVLAVVWHGQYLYALLPQVAYRLPLRRALAWFAIVAVASVVAVGPYLAGWTAFAPPGAVSLWYFPVRVMRDEAVFFIVGMLARAAAEQRAQLAGIHAELRELRRRLAESARVAERLRIAGELNDVLGHDLAALNLQLDLGMRQSGAQLAASVGVAHQAGRQLFSDIRRAIERDKAGHGTDLTSALRTLCAGVPQPQVRLTVAGLPVLNPELAHSLYSCVQEGITNAVRHARAGMIAVELNREGGNIVLSIEDNGCGMDAAQEGNGLRGMRERVEQHGGGMRIVRAAGCRIEICLPVPVEEAGSKTRGHT